MINKGLTENHQSVIKALGDQHLTSLQLFNRVENIPMILSFYDVLKDLRSMGLLNSYKKKNAIFHYLN